MYKLKDLKTFKLPRRFRCMFSRGNVRADLAIARNSIGYGKWFYISKKVLFEAIKNADETLKVEIRELVKEEEVIQDNEKELQVIENNIPKEKQEEAKLEDLSLSELFAYANNLGLTTRKDNKKETLIKKIKEKLGE